MNTALTETQIHLYQENGYLKIDRFLDPGEAAELKAAVLEAVGGMGKNKVAGRHRSLHELNVGQVSNLPCGRLQTGPI